ncbi:hypothetical protein ACWY4P_09620 [Streptomyces sp. LZ34]
MARQLLGDRRAQAARVAAARAVQQHRMPDGARGRAHVGMRHGGRPVHPGPRQPGVRGAGLITTVRAGRAVLHRRTALGGLLVRRGS